jgi:hypothetical protein
VPTLASKTASDTPKILACADSVAGVLINTAWLSVVAIAADLVAWLRPLALIGPLATREPKALRYRLLHVPGRLTRSARRRRLRIPAVWPWVDVLVAAFARVAAIPLPA